MFKTRRKHILVFNENQWKSKITEDCGFDFYWFSISINWLQLIFIDYYWCCWFLILIEWYRLEKPQWTNATAIRVCCKWIHPNVDNDNLRAWKHLRFSELEWKNSATEELKKKRKKDHSSILGGGEIGGWKPESQPPPSQVIAPEIYHQRRYFVNQIWEMLFSVLKC